MRRPRKNDTFGQWFRRQKFRNFKAHEFTNYFKVFRRGVRNSPPPKSLWTNIVPTLRIVDDVRDYFGRPVTITSSYRSPEYNRAIGKGAASKSLHMQFNALDIKVAGVSPRRVADYLYKLRRAGKFVGGIGRYKTFTHIDTRGYNASWGRN